MFNNEYFIELYKKGILKKGSKVKLDIKNLDFFQEVEDVFMHRERPFEIEEPWLVVKVNGVIYDAAWISEIENLGE